MTTTTEDAPETRSRGTLLTVLLIIFGLLSTLATAVNFLMADEIAQAMPGDPAENRTLMLALGGLGIVGLIGMAGVWMLKKWGIALYILMGVAVFAINLSVTGSIGSSLMGLVGVALLTAACIARWSHFR